MKKTRSLLFLLAVMLLAGVVRGAEAQTQTLELASPFTDRAVLQRAMPVPVWGWAKPGSTVTVTFAGQEKTARSDAQGKWKLELEPLNAALEGRDLAVTASDGESLTLKDILVGEVWFSSGQSNMDWVAGKSMCRDLANQLQRSTEELPVREYNADMGSALFLRSRVTSADGWKSSRHAGAFSALSLAFAWQLYEELKVPIGILRSTHGATPIETWTAYEGYASHPKLQDIAAKIRQSNPTTAESTRAHAKFYDDLKNWQIESEKLINRGGLALPRPLLPGISDEWKGATRMYNFKIAPLVPYAIRGAIWCQGTSNGDDGKIYAAKMEALVNGWRENWGRPDLPFYFTQQQSYGEPNPDNVGFADLREAQTLFFMGAKNVGMVPQHDLNSARPTGIHYFNKLDPGKRLARWALAHQYGKDITYTGPLYKSHRIEGNKVRVQFEQRGPGGGLMVASKGMQADYLKDPSAYVEPAKETKGEKLKHFRLASKDRVWHAADAVIEGGEVVVTSKAVPEPVGVQYAYSATPMGANLYNRAGLPAIAFAYFDGKQLFKEDDPAIVAAAKAEAERRWGKKAYLQVSSIFRDHAVIQRDLPVPVWGHGIPGTEITVVFGGQSKKTVVGEYEKWLVTLDPMPASSKGRDLTIICSDGVTKTIKDIVVGEVWILTGTPSIASELVLSRDPEVKPPKAMPLLREFRIKTKARRFATPRKRHLEIGGDFKYQAFWRPATLAEPNLDTTMAAYHFASEIQKANVPIGIISLGAENPPLTWMSYESLQTAAGFEKERDELNLVYPNTDSCKSAVVEYIETVKRYNRDVAALLRAGKDLPEELASRPPPFPQPYYNQWASRTETATHTYNFCVSPLTPFAVRGVVWIPGKDNISEDVSRYAAALTAYAASLAETYGQDAVAFVYAQPTAELVPGITKPEIKSGKSVDFSAWPKSLREIATRLGALAAEK
ncbi:MAG: hypothetical protein HQ567_34640 [Candidatus Nealsonbacteria bacterium]|nr:hypothetical protein [Candidatus Nealsonbacteria bacterium]